MINRDQVLRDLSQAFSCAEENGLLHEIKHAIALKHGPFIAEVCVQRVVNAIDQLVLPLYEPEARRHWNINDDMIINKILREAGVDVDNVDEG